MVKIICKNCNKIFNVRQAELNRGNGKYCSKSCACTFRRLRYSPPPKPNNTKCDYCNKEFYRNKSKKAISKSGLQFCCRQCKDKAQKIDSGFTELHLPHYGTCGGKKAYRKKVLNSVGIKQCSSCGYEKYISVLVVHHKDRDRTNNDLDNLEILCRNCHYEEHMKDGYSIP